MGKAQGERNASIIELRKSGRSYAFLAREFNVSRDRVRQIVEVARREEKRRDELVGKCGARPNVSVLPHETSIEVLELCDGDIHGWAARISHLKRSRTNGSARSAICVEPTTRSCGRSRMSGRRWSQSFGGSVLAMRCVKTRRAAAARERRQQARSDI
jgi:hypothetical protein